MADQSLALVLSGGGARGAYEAGVIHYIRTMLPKEASRRRFTIQCGSSVGAINTCFMASTAHDLDYQGKMMIALWKELKTENVYLRNSSALSQFIATTGAGLLGNLTQWNYFKERHGKAHHFISLFDTTPFGAHLKKIIHWEKIHENVQNGLLDAVSIVATRMRTGNPEIFLQQGGHSTYRGSYPLHKVNLGAEHAIASAAIPIVFPHIAIGDHYYVDGGIRLNTPLSPAIQLGAKRILVISLDAASDGHAETHTCPESRCPPTLGEHLGKLLNAFFLDRLKYDMDQLSRINTMIDAGEKVYGHDHLEKINGALGKDRAVHKIDCLQLSPSVPINILFSDWVNHGEKARAQFSMMERLLMRLLDVNPALNLDLLSYLTFDETYTSQVIDLGFEDARKNHDRLAAFLAIT